MKPNVKLLKRTLTKIEEVEKKRKAGKRPKLFWDQKWWLTKHTCGTAMCFAGWACQEAKVNPPSMYWFGPYATRELEITESQALNLFHERNTLPDLRRIVKKICEGPK